MGEVSLRRRRDPVTGQDVFEVKLDDDFLMSSMFVEAEVALAHLALDRLTGAATRVSTWWSADWAWATRRRRSSSTPRCARWWWWRRWTW